jgi:hypothetical protein
MDLQHRAGYRALSLGYDQDHLEWEVFMYGPFAGVIFRFKVIGWIFPERSSYARDALAVEASVASLE